MLEWMRLDRATSRQANCGSAISCLWELVNRAASNVRVSTTRQPATTHRVSSSAVLEPTS